MSLKTVNSKELAKQPEQRSLWQIFRESHPDNVSLAILNGNIPYKDKADEVVVGGKAWLRLYAPLEVKRVARTSITIAPVLETVTVEYLGHRGGASLVSFDGTFNHPEFNDDDLVLAGQFHYGSHHTFNVYPHLSLHRNIPHSMGSVVVGGFSPGGRKAFVDLFKTRS